VNACLGGCGRPTMLNETDCGNLFCHKTAVEKVAQVLEKKLAPYRMKTQGILVAVGDFLTKQKNDAC
jgi:hypothetical protein